MRSDRKVSSRIAVGLEEGADGATHVHALVIPGCVASGRTQDEALATFESTLVSWLAFLAEEGEPVPSAAREVEIVVEEWITTDADVSGGESNVCFEADRIPLDSPDLARALRLLSSLRGRLVPRIRRARNVDLEAPGRFGYSTRVILDELARAQWWTLTRLGASPMAEVPPRVVARLDTAMALILQHLGHLPAETYGGIIEIDGEEWTPRKVLRRLLWLEWTLGQAALCALDSQPAGVQ